MKRLRSLSVVASIWLLGIAVSTCAADSAVDPASALILVKTGSSADLVVDQKKQQIYSTDNCRQRDSFEWMRNGAAVRRLKVTSKVSETLAGKPLSFAMSYDMEISGDRVRLFVQTTQGPIEVPVSSSYLRGRHPCQ